MKKLYFLIIIVALNLQFVFAQTYTTVGGPSSPGGTCYCMTTAGQTATAVWEDDNLTLPLFQRTNRDLTWEYEIYLGENDNGGHGLAFVIQGESASAGGNGGAPLGYGGSSGIIPSVAIEIDTYENSFDPTSDDHMSVHLQGNHKSPASGTTPVSLPNMEDGAYHSMVVVWHYDDITPSNSSLTATIDGTYTITTNFDPAFIFNAFNPIYVGFTGGVNSLATNDQKVSFGAAGGTGSCSLSLPVEFLGFDATSLGNQEIDLNWATANEVNNDYFEVLRSSDGQMWETIAQVDGAGTTEEVSQYQMRDVVPFQGMVYYQLKQVDFNGTFSFSDVLEIEVGYKEALQLSAYPNPANDHTTLLIQSEELNTPIKIQLYHITGTQLYQQVVPATSHQQEFRLETSGLAAGIYVVKINNGKINKTQQIVVAH